MARLTAGGLIDRLPTKSPPNCPRAISAAPLALHSCANAWPAVSPRLPQTITLCPCGSVRARPVLGKTTTIAKIAAQERARRGQKLGLIAARAASASAPSSSSGCMPTLHGAPFTGAQRRRSRRRSSGRRQPVLVDTAGRAVTDGSSRDLFKRIRGRRDVRTHLVLAADTPAATARKVFEACRRRGRRVWCSPSRRSGLAVAAGRCPFRDRQLPISYLGTSQRVPEDLTRATAEACRRLRARRAEAFHAPSFMTPDTTIRPRGIDPRGDERQGRRRQNERRINLAVSLARLGHRVGIPDADLGLGNIDVMRGSRRRSTSATSCRASARSMTSSSRGRSGCRSFRPDPIRALTALTASQWTKLAGVIKRVALHLDFLLIDTAPGISDNVVELLMLAERVIVVTSFEPTAVVDAYAMVKFLTAAAPSKDVGIDAARDSDESGLVFPPARHRLEPVPAPRPAYYGYVVQDPAIRERRARAAVDCRPPAAVAGQSLLRFWRPALPGSCRSDPGCVWRIARRRPTSMPDLWRHRDARE